jgi:hypothetical protein
VPQTLLLKNRSRKNDIDICGSINLNLDDFGEGSQGSQFSGSDNTVGWECPVTFDMENCSK